MNIYRPIIDKFTVSELDMPDDFKEAVRLAVEYLLVTHASFSVAIRVAALMLESYRGELRVTDAFAAAHPENRIGLYSSPDVFLAFYLLMLAAKADNLYNAQAERETGICAEFAVLCAADNESCPLCLGKHRAGKISDCTYETVPPFHVGCRCGLLFAK